MRRLLSLPAYFNSKKHFTVTLGKRMCICCSISTLQLSTWSLAICFSILMTMVVSVEPKHWTYSNRTQKTWITRSQSRIQCNFISSSIIWILVSPFDKSTTLFISQRSIQISQQLVPSRKGQRAGWDWVKWCMNSIRSRSGPEIEPFGSMPASSKVHPNSVRDITRAISDWAGQCRVVFYGLLAWLDIETGLTWLSWHEVCWLSTTTYIGCFK